MVKQLGDPTFGFWKSIAAMIFVCFIVAAVAVVVIGCDKQKTDTVIEQPAPTPTPIPDPVLEINFTTVCPDNHKKQHEQKVTISSSTLRRVFEIYNETCNKKEEDDDN